MKASTENLDSFVVGELTNSELKSVSTLLKSVFPSAKHFSVEYLRWQYRENPDGEAITLNAFQGKELKAHYAVIPISINWSGQKTLGCLSLNTAVAPDAQGKGLFSRLASQCYEIASNKGYKFVIGVANANSTPGFVNNLGFQLVKSLDAFFFFGKAPDLYANKSQLLCKDWNEESLMWRLRRPHSKYSISGNLKENSVFSPSQLSGIDVSCLQIPEDWISMSKRGREITLSERNRLRPKIWIGVSPRVHEFPFKIQIPKFLRPSPLNFIFKDLTGNKVKIDPERVQFEVLDFDAY